jgi:hypothetical protein
MGRVVVESGLKADSTLQPLIDDFVFYDRRTVENKEVHITHEWVREMHGHSPGSLFQQVYIAGH